MYKIYFRSQIALVHLNEQIQAMRSFLRIILFVAFLAGTQADAQPIRLHIDTITGFPFAPDTAYDNRSYDSIEVVIENIGNTIYTGFIDILYTANGGAVGYLYQDPSGNHTLSPGVRDTLSISQFVFSPVYFDGGDNIVVVWPSARTAGVPVDTITGHVNVDPTIGIHEIDPPLISFSPNPVSNILSISIPDKKRLKQVRIFDIESRMLFMDSKAISIDFSSFVSGIYIIEISFDDGLSEHFRILKR